MAGGEWGGTGRAGEGDPAIDPTKAWLVKLVSALGAALFPEPAAPGDADAAATPLTAIAARLQVYAGGAWRRLTLGANGGLPVERIPDVPAIVHWSRAAALPANGVEVPANDPGYVGTYALTGQRYATAVVTATPASGTSAPTIAFEVVVGAGAATRTTRIPVVDSTITPSGGQGTEQDYRGAWQGQGTAQVAPFVPYTWPAITVPLPRGAVSLRVVAAEGGDTAHPCTATDIVLSTGW